MTAFFYLLVLLGSVQGCITAVLLYVKKPRLLSNRLLAFAVILIALPGLHLYGHYTGFFGSAGFTDLLHALVPWVAVMAVGPLLYFYTQSALDNSFRIEGRMYLHFVPVVIDLFPKLMELVFLAGGLSWWDRQTFSSHLDTYNLYADIPRWLSLAYYIQVSARFIAAKENGHSAIFNRTRRFIAAMGILVWIWFLYLIPYLIPSLNAVLKDTVGWFPVYIPLSLLIYWIGITAFYQSPGNEPAATKRTEIAPFPQALLEQTARQLILCMESDKLYLDPALDLPRLSETIQVPAKLISATVNQYMDRSFNQFVNEYRVEEFKRRILEPGAENMTLPGLAASCGFNSPATFQRSFKQITGLTPTEFLRSAAKPIAGSDQIRI